MPKKSVREMSAFEKRHHSLESKAFRSTIMGSIILGLAALIIGLGIYTYTLIHQYITEAFNLSKTTAAILHEVTDVEPLATDVLRDYHAMTDAEREGSRSDANRARFSAYTERADYQAVHKVLDDFVKDAEQFDDLTMLCAEFKGAPKDGE